MGAAGELPSTTGAFAHGVQSAFSIDLNDGQEAGMNNSTHGTSHVWLDANSDEPEILEFDACELAVYSRRCPNKESSNEDGALILSIDGERTILAVADGCGGMNAGAQAARITLTALQRTLANGANEPGSLRTPILDGIEKANASVLNLGIGAATTLAVVEVLQETIRPYHIGDSQIVVVGNHGKIKLQTSAHSPVGYAVEAGVLSEDEAMYHQDRHVVSNVVGARDGHIEIGSRRRMSPRDTLLLATDGVFDNLHVEEICALIRKGPLINAARNLAMQTQARIETSEVDNPSKPDDSTFILFRRRLNPK